MGSCVTHHSRAKLRTQVHGFFCKVKKDGDQVVGSKEGIEVKKRNPSKEVGVKESDNVAKSGGGSSEGSKLEGEDKKQKQSATNLVACLKVPINDSHHLSLLIKNMAKGPLLVAIVAPDFVRLDETIIQLEEKENRKIHNEQIGDLLDPTPRNLEIKDDPKNGFYVDNLTEEYVTTYEDVTQIQLKQELIRAKSGGSFVINN